MLILCMAVICQAQFFPSIDEQKGWSYYGKKGYIYSVYLPIIEEDGISTAKKSMFNKISFESAHVCSEDITKDDLTHDRDVNGEYRGTRWLQSYFSYNCLDGIKREMYVHYSFTPSGYFYFGVNWLHDPGNTASFAKFKIDYDIETYDDNIVDFVDYSWGRDQYRASAIEFLQNYSDVEAFEPNEIQKNVSARFTKATSPEQQIGFVLLMNLNIPYSLTVLRYPATNDTRTGKTIQTVSGSGEGSYAYSGTDQVAWVTLRENPDRLGKFEISGQAFVRPNARPIKLYVNIQKGLSSVDFTQLIGGGNTLRDALNSLTHSKWESITTTDLDNPHSVMTDAQLHEFMMNNREHNGIYSNRGEFTKYLAEINIVNAEYGPKRNWWGVMFDDGSDGNSAHREGSAILYKSIEKSYTSLSDRNETVAWAFAHELGHHFNFSHQMSGCGGTDCTQSGDVPTIMGYSLGETFSGSKVLHNNCTGEYNSPVIDFYQNGPESWVKSGRFGIPFMDYASTITFQPYQ